MCTEPAQLSKRVLCANIFLYCCLESVCFLQNPHHNTRNMAFVKVKSFEMLTGGLEKESVLIEELVLLHLQIFSFSIQRN